MVSKEKEIKYGDAIKELDSILERLQAGEIDIDDLSKEVKRAVELIKLCKSKIERTELEIKDVMKEFETNKK